MSMQVCESSNYRQHALQDLLTNTSGDRFITLLLLGVGALLGCGLVGDLIT